MSRKSYPNVNAANQYARDVVRGKIVACQFVIQACQRHLDDLMAEKSKSFRYRFDKDLAERAAKFIQLLPHTKGEWAFKRMPITLEPWQLFVICCAFGWVNKGSRLRRFREVYTEIPRKNGKSAISAGVALYCFACDNEFGAEVYSGATTEKQAWEVFRPARLMCKRTPMLTEAFGIEVNASNMNRPEDGARFEPLIGNPGDGSSPHCAVVDEYHEHATDALYTTMLTGMGARRQPLMWAITTAGYNIEGPCYDKRREVIEMLNGSVPMTSFNTIPSNTLVPIFYAEMDNSAANTAQDSGASLLIGHANNGAEIVANSLVLMPSADYARQICGAGSQLARMVEAYRQTDPFGELYVIAVPESTGAAATVTLTVTGAATETGTVNVYVGRTRVQAPVTNGDNVATIASSIKDAINAVPTLPFTASSSAGVVTLTARHKGLCGNEIPVSLNYYGFGGGEVLPAGVQIAVATGTAGTGAPVLTGAVAAMADEPFDYIGLPFNDTASVNTLVTEMNDTSGRWSYARQLYGHVYTAKIGTLSELVTAGDQFNQQHITLAGYEKETQTPADELAASRTARAAVFIRNDPARPTQTGELVGMLPAPKGKRFTMTEQQTLLSHGVATAYVESGVLRIQRDVTTYRKNAYGVADNSYLDSETLHTSAYVLRKLKSVITSKYGRHKLASDGIGCRGYCSHS